MEVLIFNFFNGEFFFRVSVKSHNEHSLRRREREPIKCIQNFACKFFTFCLFFFDSCSCSGFFMSHRAHKYICHLLMCKFFSIIGIPLVCGFRHQVFYLKLFSCFIVYSSTRACKTIGLKDF